MATLHIPQVILVIIVVLLYDATPSGASRKMVSLISSVYMGLHVAVLNHFTM